MNHIATVIGTRPQIIKSAAISRCIRIHFSNELKETVIHTGQHYDYNMSGVFFKELDLPISDHNLEVGSGLHGAQIAQMIARLEILFQTIHPRAVLVYGDTNSTLAASIVASKMQLPLIHVEAGLRSFNKKMPEEINRIICDHSAALLFCPTADAVKNLENEGLHHHVALPYHADAPGIFHSGDIMLDNALHFQLLSEQHASILTSLQLNEKKYFLATVHRESNTDSSDRLKNILNAFLRLVKETGIPIVWPVHPRIRKKSEQLLDVFYRLHSHPLIHLIEPVSYLDMIQLESHASLILTDSGGVQKEAFFFQKPCVILREQTEWVELAKNGNACIADADEEKIIQAVLQLTEKKDFTWPDFYGNGNAAIFICEKIVQWLKTF